jgi:hypothetical protein
LYLLLRSGKALSVTGDDVSEGKKVSKGDQINLAHLDRDNCRRCRGSGYVVNTVEFQPGVFIVEQCPEGCEPEFRITEIRLPATVDPLSFVVRLTPDYGEESRVVAVKTPEG